jgi:RNA polymerase sigma-70 factor (ECF subfamily)
MKDDGRELSETVALVKAGQTGDRAAFDRLVLLHQRQAMGLALGILGNVHDAAEVVQDALVKAYLGLGGLNQPERFQPWLLKIVANAAISRCRSARRHRILTRIFVAGTVERRAAEPPEGERGEELRVAIERALERLSAKEAEAIALFGLDDLPHREVGRIMGCSTGAARWHVHRARKKLRVLLKDYLG